MRKHGKPKENALRKREKGGPAVAADLVVALRLPIETRQAVLAWAKGEPGQPNLSEAIRRLIDTGLGSVRTAAPGKTPQVASDKPAGAGKATGGPEAQPVAKPIGDDNSYQMPEDLKAFNEYWAQAEDERGRELSYEEVIVLFNQARHPSKILE